MTGVTATYSGTSLTVNFGENKTINQGVDSTAPNKIKIETTCEGQGLSNKDILLGQFIDNQYEK